jgi:hypothetical protein
MTVRDGSFPMDYSKSLFEVYEDAINFHCSVTRIHTIPEEDSPSSVVEERMRTTVHFSQLIHKVLGGASKMREDLAKRNPGQNSAPFPPPIEAEMPAFYPFRITGVHTGSISSIGPSFRHIISMPDTTRNWKAELENHRSNLVQLRKKNEAFMRVLLSLNRTDLAKIFSIDSHLSWNVEHENARPNRVRNKGKQQLGNLLELSVGPIRASTPEGSDELKNKMESGTDDSRLFLTDTGEIGLVPPNTLQGDMIYQFWHSDSAAIVRRVGDRLRIVGRAVAANSSFVEGSKFHKLDFGGNTDVKELYMDIRTLQLMTQ